MYPGDMTPDRHLIDDYEDEKEEGRELNFEQHVVDQNLLNGTDNKKKDLREVKQKGKSLS